MLRVLVLFALVTPFWSLFDQKASTWVLQADQMTKPAWFQSSMMQALNPALVMHAPPPWQAEANHGTRNPQHRHHGQARQP